MATAFSQCPAKNPVLRGTRLCAPKVARFPVQCRAEALDGSSSATNAPQQPHRSMIRSLAAAVELTGQVQRYETFAGRSAMVGVAAAVAIELITDRSVFLAVNSDTALAYAGVALMTLASAVGVALARGGSSTAQGSGSVDVLESVYASLTAVKRSAASVTQAQVDKAVDYLLETVLDSRFDSFSIDGLLLSDDDA